MAKAPAESATQAKSTTPTAPDNSALFGDFVNGLKSLSSLFGSDKQSFSNQPAIDNLYTQQQFGSNAAAETANLAALGQRGSSALSNQSADTASQRRVNEAQAMKNALGSSGSSTYMGAGAFSSPFRTDEYLRDRGFDAQAAGRFDFQRNQALQSTELFGRANANVDAYRQQQINEANLAMQRGLTNLDIDRMNRQSSIQSQSDANNFLRQRELSAQQIEGQKAIASMQAQGNILSSLFGSVSSGSPNYRYWN